jgi:hypothetical protein
MNICIMSARSSSLAELLLWVGPVTRFIKLSIVDRGAANPKIGPARKQGAAQVPFR